MDVAIDYFDIQSMMDFVESFTVQIVSDKCDSFNTNTNNMNTMNNIYDHNPTNLQTKEGIDHNDSNMNMNMNEVLLGYAQENEPITFIDYSDIEGSSSSESELSDTDVEIDHLPDIDIHNIEDNNHMDHIFNLDLEIEETLASALDLLPEFCSIPIPVSIADERYKSQSQSSRNNTNTNNNNIDKCLTILKNLDVNRIRDAQENNKYEVMNKIIEMRHIIESLQTQIGNNEGFVCNATKPCNDNCEYSRDPHVIDMNEDEDEGEDQELLRIDGNITLMGEGHITS